MALLSVALAKKNREKNHCFYVPPGA